MRKFLLFFLAVLALKNGASNRVVLEKSKAKWKKANLPLSGLNSKDVVESVMTAINSVFFKFGDIMYRQHGKYSNELDIDKGHPASLIIENDVSDKDEIPIEVEEAAAECITDGVYEEQPCDRVMCGHGKECQVDEQMMPRCDCAEQCPDGDEVCGSDNVTYESICHLYRERCLCRRADRACGSASHVNLQLNYLGTCKELEPCRKEHLKQFPARMADWLFRVMRDLKKRRELHGFHWEKLIEEAEQQNSLKHAYAVIWKYCELDTKPHDKFVSHHELIPLTAPVMPTESCIKPFLEECDANRDEKISLVEWGKCLGLREEEIVEQCYSA